MYDLRTAVGNNDPPFRELFPTNSSVDFLLQTSFLRQTQRKDVLGRKKG
jgi:hypothetical protein